MIRIRRSNQPKPSTASPDCGSIIAPIFIIVFGSIFLACGLFSLTGKMRDKSGNPAPLMVSSVFILTGGTIAFTGIALIPYSRRMTRIQQAFPDQPWRHRRDWSTGLIHSSNKSHAMGSTFFTVLWNSLALPISLLMFQQNKVHGLGWVILVFPLVGLVLIVATIRQWLIHLKWGASVLRLEQFPPRVSSVLSGKLELSRPIMSLEPVHLVLSCIQVTVTGTGKSRRTTRTSLFDSEQLLPSDNQISLPINFQIPGNLPQFSATTNPSIEWQLKVVAKTSGTDFAAQFDLPVSESDPTASTSLPSTTQTQTLPMSLEQIIRDPGIRITPRINAMHFEFDAARHKSGALMLFLFAAVFGSVAVGTIVYGACIAVPILTGLVSLLTLYGFLSSILPRSSFTATRSGIEGSVCDLFRTRRINIPTHEIDTIEPITRSQTNETIYFSIDLKTKSGKTEIIARGIRGRNAAQAIIDQIKKTLVK